MSHPDAEHAVKKVLEHAALFRQRHVTDPEVGRTYGYFTRHPVSPLNHRRLRAIATEVQAHAKHLGRPLRILDVACGGGVITCALAGMGHRVLGMDLSAEEVRLAKLFAQEELLDGLFARADLIADPDWERLAEEILGSRPDVVVLAYALHHLPQVENFVERLSRWLPAGSLVIVNEENPRAPLFRLKHLVRGWIQKDTDTEWHRAFPEWRRLLEACQFRVAPEPRGFDLLPPLAIRPSWCWSLVFSATRA